MNRRRARPTGPGSGGDGGGRAKPALELRSERAQPLLAFLLETMPARKRGDVKRLLRFGCVRVNGAQTTRHDHALEPGDVIVVERGAAPEVAASAGFNIVFEDAAIVVVNKPAGLLTVGRAGEEKPTLLRALNDWYRATRPRRGQRLLVVHRLDRDTSGLLVFTWTDEARAALQDRWERVEKRYYAVVEGCPVESEGRIESRLAEDRSLRVHTVRKGPHGKLAVTRYRVLRLGPMRTLLDIHLETGRKNQIRVHLAEMGHPVVGDRKYGGGQGRERLALHAYWLAFEHPVTGERLAFETPLPDDLKRLLKKG